MIHIQNMALVGAAERNVGKTEFACNLIKRIRHEFPVIGIKITVIKEQNGECPRGGKGCGVCSSLKGDFLITEEYNRDTSKDTSRMLKAGAEKVYWLRVLKDKLEYGVQALFKRIKEENSGKICFICESNSARLAIDPGVFIVIRKKGSSSIKASCSDVIKFADKIVLFDSDKIEHDYSVGLISFNGNAWNLSEDAR